MFRSRVYVDIELHVPCLDERTTATDCTNGLLVSKDSEKWMSRTIIVTLQNRLLASLLLDAA